MIALIALVVFVLQARKKRLGAGHKAWRSLVAVLIFGYLSVATMSPEERAALSEPEEQGQTQAPSMPSEVGPVSTPTVSEAVVGQQAREVAEDGQGLTLANFEKSQIFSEFSLAEKDNWAINTGGENYWYGFRHDNGADYMVVEAGPNKKDIRRFSLQFPSDLNQNSLDAREKLFILDGLKYFSPTSNHVAILQYIEGEINNSYSGGSAAYPRKAFGDLKVYAGRTTGTIIGFER